MNKTYFDRWLKGGMMLGILCMVGLLLGLVQAVNAQSANAAGVAVAQTPPLTFSPQQTPPPTSYVTLYPIAQIGGKVGAVAYQNGYVYIGVGARLVILNVYDLANPYVAGQVEFTRPVLDIVVSGNYFFVAIGTELIGYFFDQAAPAAPVWQSSSSGLFRQVFWDVSNQQIYAVGGNLLQVLNTFYPNDVSLLGSYTHSSCCFKDVVASADRAYVLASDGLLSLDITFPYSITRQNTVKTPAAIAGQGLAIASGMDGSYLYLASGDLGLYTYQIVASDTLVETGHVGLAGERANDVRVDVSTAYVAASVGGLFVVDVTDKAAPSIVGHFDTPGFAWSLDVTRTEVYLADDDALRIINVAPPNNLYEVGQFVTHGPVHELAVQDHTIYAMDSWSAGGLRTFDVLSPSVPTFQSAMLYNLEKTTNVSILDGAAYYGLPPGGRLAATDVSDPSNLQYSCENPFSFVPVAVDAFDRPQGGRRFLAVAAGADGFKVVEATDPCNMRLVSQLLLPGTVQQVTVQGRFAYVANSAGLGIIDLSDPFNPQPLDSYPLSDTQHIEVVGNIAYVTAGGNNLTILDVSSPSNILLLGNYYASNRVLSVNVLGRYAFLAEGEGGIEVVDVADPAMPTWAGSSSTAGFVQQIVAANGYLYLANGDGGLQVMEVYYDPVSTIQGRVTDATGSPLSDVTVRAGSGHAVHTDADGRYFLWNMPGGQHLVIPQKWGYEFTPSFLLADVYTSTYQQDFVAAPVQYSVSGRVTDSAGRPLAGAVVFDNLDHQVTTGASGEYTLPVTVNSVYVTAMYQDLSLAPGTQYIQVPPDQNFVDFTVPIDLVKLAQVSGGSSRVVGKLGNIVYTSIDRRLAAFDVTDPATPTQTGRTVPFGAMITALAINGSRAYVGTDSAGLGIVDLSDPAHPVFSQTVATGCLSVHNLALDDRAFLYLACDYGLQVLSLANPDLPVPVAWLDTPNAWAMAIGLSIPRGRDPAEEDYVPGTTGYLYMGNNQYGGDGSIGGQDGLYVIDITNPYSPSQKTLISGTGCAGDIYVLDSYAYLANCNDHSSLLSVVNLIDGVVVNRFEPAALTWRSGALTMNYDSNQVYFSNGAQLYTLDYALPYSPSLLSTLGGIGFVDDLALDAGLLYLAKDNYGLQVLDVTNAANPLVKSSLPNDAPVLWPFRLALQEPYAYLADGDGGFKIFDISNPLAPALLSRFKVGHDAQGLAVSETSSAGQYAYIGFSNEGLSVVDITDPRQPQEVAFLPLTEKRILDIVIEGNYAYLAGETTGLRVVKIAPLSELGVVQEFPLPSTRKVEVVKSALQGGRVYASATDGLHIYEVRDLAAPNLVERGLAAVSQAMGFVTRGNLVYLASFNGFSILDVSVISAPVRVGFYDVGVWDVALVDQQAYLAGSGYIKVLNVADPRRLVESGFAGSECASIFTLSRRYLYATGCSDGLRVFRLASPRPLDVTPAWGLNDVETTITVHGANFQPGAVARLKDVTLQNVAVSSSEILSANVPPGLPAGTYPLIVVNPDGGMGLLPLAYTVLTSAPPDVTEVDPGIGPDNLPVMLNIYGSNFAPTTTVELLSGDQSFPLMETAFISATHLRALVPISLTVGSYDVLVANGALTDVLPAAYTIFDMAQLDDLYALRFDLWADPPQPQRDAPAVLGLTLRRRGGQSVLNNVRVDFYRGDPEVGGAFLGSGIVAELQPNSEMTASIAITPRLSGNFNIYAVIDPMNDVSETLEGNNILHRIITVLPPGGDITPPTVVGFSINGGGLATTSPQVLLNTEAVDDSGSVASLLFIEYEFVQSSADWVVTQMSEWLPYTAVAQDYSWQLTPGVGAHYIQVWAADASGNISLEPAMQFINYFPVDMTVVQGQVSFFRIYLQAGDVVRAAIDSLSGDADLYVFTPDGFLVGKSETGNASEWVDFVAEVGGIYQVEVEGSLDTTFGFILTWNGVPYPDLGAGRVSNVLQSMELRRLPASPGDILSRGRITPYCAPGDDPGNDVGVPNLGVEPGVLQVFMPLVVR